MPSLEDTARLFKSGFRTNLDQGMLEPRWVGLENEYPMVSVNGGIMDPEVLEYLWGKLADQGWESIKDEITGKTIAVKKKRDDLRGKKIHHYDMITTDLGYATLEIDLAPAPSINIAQKHLYALLDLVTSILSKRNTLLLGYGVQPLAKHGPAHIGPKSRYKLMLDICNDENVINPDGYGVDLHTIDASCQTQVEISTSEAIPVLNALNATSGLRIALLTNSSVWQNKAACWKAIRLMFVGWSWPARKQQLGMPPKFRSIEHYIDYILDFRSIAVRRGHELYKLDNHSTFRQFFADECGQVGVGLNGHVTKIFSEVEDIQFQAGFAWFNARLQPVYGTIEDRISCQQPPQAHLCASALTVGLVENHEELAKLADTLSLDQWRDIQFLAIKHGLDFVYPGVHISYQIETMLSIAAQGLRKRGFGEEVYLEPLYQRVAKCRCPSDEVLLQLAYGGIAKIVASNDMRNLQ